ncbi:hypothetical protein MNBD_ALPHA06-1614 [hydrothermal vent metagenome]|uniref:DUF484 family protein n=1 Tax=hydrothermal vent metagenome TaxID=652676 RepID=A0A3B0RX11_9ZZZZ
MAEQANIIDFEAASRVRMLERVRSLTMTRDALIENAKQNHASTALIHGAVLKLLDAKNWHDLDTRLQYNIRTTLGADFLGLYVEGAKLPKGLERIFAKPEGFVTHVMQGHFERLGPGLLNGPLLFGEQANQIRSEALLRLDWGPGEALLVFGSKDRRAFSAEQGTDLIAFFAKAVERLISRWAG